MFKLWYYCKAQGNKEIVELLAKAEAKHNIQYEILDLSRDGAYDEEKEKQVYERDFKPKAKILKKRTGEPITRLRSRKAGHYFVSLPGTIAIVRDGQVEWYTIGVQEIINFVKKVLSNGHTFLRECCG